jgi:hypothetical protein
MASIFSQRSRRCRGRLAGVRPTEHSATQQVEGPVAQSEAQPGPGRFAVALATFGTVCVLGAAGAILAPVVADSNVGMAVIAAALSVAAAVGSWRLGDPADTLVNRTVADVLAAGAAFYLAGAAGNLTLATGAEDSLTPVVAAAVALPYALTVQLRRPGLWTLLATSASVLVAVIGLVHLVHGVAGQSYAAALVLVAVSFAMAAARGVLAPIVGVVTVSALAALAAGAVLLGEDPGAMDLLFALVLLAIVALAAALLALPSLVGALAVGTPVVVGLALGHGGYGLWSVPLAMAWSGGGCAVVAAYVGRGPRGERVGGVLTWCALLVIVGDLFLTSSDRSRAAVALAVSIALFAAAASSRRRPASVIGALGVLAALPRVVANATAGRFLVLGLGLGLLYLATASMRRRA